MLTAFSPVDPRFLAILQACRTSIDPCIMTGISRLTAQISQAKHGLSYDRSRYDEYRTISHDIASLTCCGGGIFTLRPTVFGHPVDMSDVYRSMQKDRNSSIDSRDMANETWPLTFCIVRKTIFFQNSAYFSRT